MVIAKRYRLLQTSWAITVFLFTLLVNTPNSWSATTTVRIGQDLRVFVPMKSYKALRDENMVRQAYDYSCGAAALATLLTYGLGDQLTEADILQEVLTALSKEDLDTRKKKGLSLLDLQKVAHDRGHKAQGFKLAPEFLRKLAGPVLVFIKPRGYEHFAILKGIREDRAYLADPSLGNVRLPLYQFLDMWLDETGKGVIFVVERTDGTGHANSPLFLPEQAPSQPEVLSTRQLLETRPFPVRLPQVLQSLP